MSGPLYFKSIQNQATQCSLRIQLMKLEKSSHWQGDYGFSMAVI